MFRKFLIAAVASLALLAPLAFPAQSDAHGPRGGHRVAAHRYAGHRYNHGRYVHRSSPYRVYYRTGYAGPWLVTGSYGCRADALRAAAAMPGCQTFVR